MAMAGAIIENMSTKKLLLLGFSLLALQLLSIMVGVFIAPSPTSAFRYLAAKCINVHRRQSWLVPWGSNRCHQVHSFDEPLAKTLDANNIVFAVHVPMPNQKMSPLFQYMLAVLQLDVAFKINNQIENEASVTLDAGLAYRDDFKSEWTTMFRSVEKRPLRCTFALPKTSENEGHFYHCEPISLVELESMAHKYFLINIRLPVNDTVNVGIGEIKDVHVVGIHQNGGFTKVWLCMKTVFSPWIFVATVWYWHRIRLMARPPVLFEKAILALGLSLMFLNCPVEWLSLTFEWTWMLLFEDVRQGFFYCTLFCFWIIFCGEHLMDQSVRNRLSAYWWQVGLVLFGSCVLLIFDLCERGIHLNNPFHSVWATDIGSRVAMTFIILAAISVCLYFLSLCCMVRCVFRNIGGKLQQLSLMPEARRLRYQGIIFRFKFLMLVSLTCAAMTVISFILNQISEGHFHTGDYTLQVNSGFLTGVYGMWNLYVFSIIFLYAPSHKHRAKTSGDSRERERLEKTERQLTGNGQGPTETYDLSGKVAEE